LIKQSLGWVAWAVGTRGVGFCLNETGAGEMGNLDSKQGFIQAVLTFFRIQEFDIFPNRKFHIYTPPEILLIL